MLNNGLNYFVENNLVHYSVLFNFGHIRRWDQCAVFILYSKISTDPGLLKIRHSHRFVAVVIQILIPLSLTLLESNVQVAFTFTPNRS